MKISSIIFWQQFASMHNFDLLTNLSRYLNVILVVDVIHDELREKMGWTKYEDMLPRFTVLISPTLQITKSLIEDPGNLHILSGFTSGISLKSALSTLKHNQLSFVLLNEPPDVYGVRFIISFARYVKYFLFFISHLHLIQGVLAIGREGEIFYKQITFSKKSVVPFGYFIGKPESFNNVSKTMSKNISDKALNEKIRLLFVGRLVKYKGIIELLQSILALPENIINLFELEIIGEGEQEQEIIEIIARNNLGSLVNLINFQTNVLVREKIRNADVLCLINISTEGWGAVINEAILEGTYVLCTKHTGSSILLESVPELLGIVIKDISVDNIKSALINIYNNIENIRLRRYERVVWSKKIHPDTIAKYFMKCLLYFQDSKVGKPVPPWGES